MSFYYLGMELSQKNFSNVTEMWKPNEKNGKQIKKLMKRIQEKYHIIFDDYWDFHQWTVEHISEFWAEMWDFTGIIYSKKYNQVVDLSIPLEESPKWFEGAEMNYAENLLKFRDDKLALIIAGEDRETEKITYAQLYKEATLYAAAFRKFGIKKGDVIACYMSNRKEAILGMLAAVSIGGIWTGALPQIGHQAVINRIFQVNPKLLLTEDRFSYNKVEIEMLGKVEQIANELPTLQKVIIVPSREDSKPRDINKIMNSCFLDEFLELGREEDGSILPIIFEQVSISYPVYINYTSGTTGLPKPIVHGSGMLLTIARDYVVHMDSERGDVFFSISSVGWASWSMFTTLLFCGRTVLLFRGYPYFLSPTSLWDMIDEHQITHLLLQASVVDELEKRRYLPTDNHSLRSLKLFLSGGSVVKSRSYDFVYNELKLDLLFGSVYGCTELMGSCLIIDFTLPIHKGELSSCTLGTSVECLNETGKSVKGEVGELVITKPYPAMVLSVWGDTDGSKLHEKYFSKYPGKFLIGDTGIINPITKGFTIHGRCDDILKQRGCRFGCSEIYDVVDAFSEVRDSLCASQYNKDMDERAVLFLKMGEGHTFDDHLVNRIREAIARDLTPRHVPDVIIETGDIPYNNNGKKMEIIVKKIINNWPCTTDVVDNLESLKFYYNRTELQDF